MPNVKASTTWPPVTLVAIVSFRLVFANVGVDEIADAGITPCRTWYSRISWIVELEMPWAIGELRRVVKAALFGAKRVMFVAFPRVLRIFGNSET